MGNAARPCELCSAVTASACPCTNPPHHRAALRESSLSTPHFSFWIAYAMRVECLHFSLSPTAAGSADTQKLFFRWCSRTVCVCAPSLSSSLARRLATRSMRGAQIKRKSAVMRLRVLRLTIEMGHGWAAKILLGAEPAREFNSRLRCLPRVRYAAFHFHIALVLCQHHALHRVYASSRYKWIKYFLASYLTWKIP